MFTDHIVGTAQWIHHLSDEEKNATIEVIKNPKVLPRNNREVLELLINDDIRQIVLSTC